MKKFVIIISVITLASCSLLPDKGSKDIEAINVAEQNAKKSITEHTNKEVVRAKNEISTAVASVISKADSTLTRQFSAVEESLSIKADETKKELSDKISEIENNITNAKAISFIGIIIGLFGIVMAFLAYRKKPRTNVNRVKDLIQEEINTNDFIRNEIRKIVGGQNSSYRSTATAPSQASIDRAIETYMTSKKFRDILQQHMSSPIVQSQNVEESVRTVHTVTPNAKPLYQIYAKESSSMVLSSIQDTYQKGKSIYKLTITEQNATTAEVSICIEQEEVRQRILKFDSQYLEPICTVIRSSNEPTQVVVKTVGMAERSGDEWNVVKPIIVEIK